MPAAQRERIGARERRAERGGDLVGSRRQGSLQRAGQEDQLVIRPQRVAAGRQLLVEHGRPHPTRPNKAPEQRFGRGFDAHLAPGQVNA